VFRLGGVGMDGWVDWVAFDCCFTLLSVQQAKWMGGLSVEL